MNPHTLVLEYLSLTIVLSPNLVEPLYFVVLLYFSKILAEATPGVFLKNPQLEVSKSISYCKTSSVRTPNFYQCQLSNQRYEVGTNT